MNKDQQLQQKYLELQMAAQQIQQLQQQIQEIQIQSGELDRINSGLDDLKNTKKDTETLVPLGAGIFFKAKAQDVNKLIMRVGSDLAVEKSLPEAKELVEAQQKEISKIIEEMERQLQQTMLYAQVLQQELQKLAPQQ